jgi:hypothetical protein
MSKTSVDWVVTASGERSLDQIAADLRKKGFKVERILREIGAITGRGGDDIAARIRQINGVADVSRNVPIDIGPPNSSDPS